MTRLDAGLALRSLVTSGGTLELSLVEVATPEPGYDEVVVAVEATPLNPSDQGLLLAGADIGSARVTGTAGRPVTTITIPSTVLPSLAGRLDQPMPVGNEGAGTVVAAGGSPEARALLGRTVAVLGGGMLARYRLVKAADCLALPDGATAADGASAFINPLTALGMVDTMRAEGHGALVHTAAASNLGRMLVKICRADEVGLVNIVRSPAQVALLHGLGAAYVCDSTSPGFTDDLVVALRVTGATLAFDAIGGGRLASQILNAMEAAAPKDGYSRYGSELHKQVYLYGGLDTGPTELVRGFGMAWGVGGWLVTYFLRKAGPERVAALKARVAAELTTTFASHYTRTLSLADVLDPANIASYAARATGEKVLINPSL